MTSVHLFSKSGFFVSNRRSSLEDRTIDSAFYSGGLVKETNVMLYITGSFARVSRKVPKSFAFAKDFICKRSNTSTYKVVLVPK